MPSEPAWITHEYLQQIEAYEAKRRCEWLQMSLSRLHKKEILLEAGTIGEDANEQESWDEIEVFGSKCPPRGLEAQTMIYGGAASVLKHRHRQAIGSMDGTTILFPQLLRCFVNKKAEVDYESCLQALVDEIKDIDSTTPKETNSKKHWKTQASTTSHSL